MKKYPTLPLAIISGSCFLLIMNAFSSFDIISDGAQVPEPAILLLFGVGLMGLAGYSKKHNKKH